MNMKKIACLLSISLCLGMGTTTNAKAAANPERIGGASRYDTSISISRNGWNASSDYVVIASGEDFGDALSAAPLAKKYNAPILLVSKDNLDNQSTAANLSNEITRLKAKKAIIIGGTGVISLNVENVINSKGVEIQRIAGNDRYETSVEIAKAVGATKGVVLAVGDSFGDALSAAPIAATKGMPIILVPKDKITQTLESYVKNNSIPKTYVIGDKDVISDDVVKQFPGVERITGSNEYERNINLINKFSKDLDYDNVYLASNKGFADGLSGSALAALTASPIILVDENSEANAKQYLVTNVANIGQVIVLGGEGAVKASVLDKVVLANSSQGLVKAFVNQSKVNSMESNNAFTVNVTASGLDKEAQDQVNRVLPMINASKINFDVKMNSNSAKTVSDVQEDIAILAAGMKIDTTVWVSMDMSGTTPKMKEVIKVPSMLAAQLPKELAGKQYMVMDLAEMSSKTTAGAPNFTGLMDFTKNVQPQFQNFMEKYLANYNPGFKFINYNGLTKMDTKDGVKYAQTYQLKLNDATFKALVRYTANDAVNNKELLELVKKITISTVEASGTPDSAQAKKEIDQMFANVASNPQAVTNIINNFMDTIKDLKVIGDKGIDITYYVCDGYIVGEKGTIDLQLDIHKLGEVMNKLNNIKTAVPADQKGVFGLTINYDTQNQNINRDVKVTMPNLNSNNSFDYTELMKAQTSGTK